MSNETRTEIKHITATELRGENVKNLVGWLEQIDKRLKNLAELTGAFYFFNVVFFFAIVIGFCFAVYDRTSHPFCTRTVVLGADSKIISEGESGRC